MAADEIYSSKSSYDIRKESDPTGSKSSSTITPSRQPANTHAGHDSQSDNDSETRDFTGNDRRELTENDCYDKQGFRFPWYKKWAILSVVFTVQMSMTFNSSVYPNAVILLSEHFHISEQAARVGQRIFLVAYTSA